MLTAKYSRQNLALTPTPLQPLHNLSQFLQGPNIWVKRDDCTGLAMGGNKARQLEFYIGDALSKGADVILTSGSVQSNQVCMTIAAARKVGLESEVFLEKNVPNRGGEYYQSGNPFLAGLYDAKINYHVANTGDADNSLDDMMYLRAKEIRKAGGNPYVIAISSDDAPLGSLGYVRCAQELLEQFTQNDLNVDAIVLASGSSTTQAGLLTGLRALNSDIAVYGFCVRRNQTEQAQRVIKKCRKVEQLINCPNVVTDDDVWVSDSMLTPGYGLLNDNLIQTIQTTAKQEGLLLDPTYTGKAMAGLFSLVDTGHFTKDQNILFLHTGGLPALFGYPEIIEKSASPQ
jgi:D-cysteine desulfhydrase family pyridoxal phosphate-dependent enzyme